MLMKKFIMLVALTFSVFAFDSEIVSVTIVEAPTKEVIINGVKFKSGATYLFEFLDTDAKDAIELAVEGHDKLIKSVTFKHFN